MEANGASDEGRSYGARILFVHSIMTFGAPAWADAAADVRALEDRFVAAFKAKDVDAIMKAYAPDQTLVVFDVVPPRQYAAPRPTAKIGKLSSAASTARSPSG